MKLAALTGAVLLAGAALAAAPAASAQPSSDVVVHPMAIDSGHSYGTSSTCSHSSDGWFVADGDTSHITDTCADGWSAVLEVDEQPLQTQYDYAIWENDGAGSTKAQTHNVTEGHTVCIRAGIGHPSTGEITNLGNWKCGTA